MEQEEEGLEQKKIISFSHVHEQEGMYVSRSHIGFQQIEKSKKRSPWRGQNRKEYPSCMSMGKKEGMSAAFILASNE